MLAMASFLAGLIHGSTRDATLDALAWCRRENVLKLAEFIGLRMSCMGTPTVLLASGSNACGQLANGTIDDSHRFSPCNFVGCLPGRLPPDTCQIFTTTPPPPPHRHVPYHSTHKTDPSWLSFRLSSICKS